MEEAFEEAKGAGPGGTGASMIPAKGKQTDCSAEEGLGAIWGFCRSCKGVFSKGGTKICYDDHGRDSL